MHGIVTGSPEAAVESGVTPVFFPHGIGHLLGLRCTTSAGFARGPTGGTREKPAGHPYLRLTRELEPGFAVTIEPGIYFIDSLLSRRAPMAAAARSTGSGSRRCGPTAASASRTTWSRSAGAPRNLTREAFAAAA